MPWFDQRVVACPVCQSRLTAEAQRTAGGGWLLLCPRCGSFAVDVPAALALEAVRMQPLRWAVTSHAIRRMHAAGQDAYQTNISEAWLQSLWANANLPNPQAQADYLIEHLALLGPTAGQWVACNPQHLGAVLGTSDDPTEQGTRGFGFILDRLQNTGLVERQGSGQGGLIQLRLMFDGWHRFQESRRSTVDSRVAFMAMSYDPNSVAAQALPHFVRGVALTGFELRRLDQKPKAGLIDLRMRVEIRSAKFLVADLTDDNRGAYWESGFAEGLDKKVYYTCEKSAFQRAGTHFDTEHLLTVKWSLNDIAIAVDELKAAIRNDFPTESRLLD